MNHEAFKLILGKSSKKQFRIGLLFLVIGLLFAAVPFLDTSDVGTAGIITIYVLTGITLLIGVYSMYLALKTKKLLAAGSHPLMSAILNGDQSYVVWFHEQVTTVKNFESRADHQIWIYHNTMRPITVAVKKQDVTPTMNYLQSHFPKALVGFSEENRKKAKELFKLR